MWRNIWQTCHMGNYTRTISKIYKNCHIVGRVDPLKVREAHSGPEDVIQRGLRLLLDNFS